MKCQKCQTENSEAYNFCSKCGSKLLIETKDNYLVSVKKTKMFFFILLGYIALLHLLKFNSTYITSLISDLIFALIIVVFVALNFKDIKEILSLNFLNLKTATLLALSLSILAFAVSHFTDLINKNLFNSSYIGYYEQYKDAPFPLLISIISVAIFPAIFEELAFRGILFNELKNIMPVNATIIITSVLFTLLHFSIISFFWIFPLGYLFGYLRSKYNNLIYGIIGHFIYNSCVILIEYFNI